MSPEPGSPRPCRDRTRVSDPALHQRFQAFDLLASMVAVVDASGAVLFVNAALEDTLGVSRRSVTGALFPDFFTQPHVL